MNPQQLIDGLRRANQDLERKNEELKTLAENAAEAEKLYRIAAAEKTLNLKADGQAATLIPTLVKGDKHVAELRFQRDVAREILKAGRAAVQGLIEKIGSYRSLLTWAREELHNQ